MTVINAAAVQISPVLYSRDGTVDRVVRKIIELGRQGVQFGDGRAVLPLFRARSGALPDEAWITSGCLSSQ